jgi:hypothetical protein
MKPPAWCWRLFLARPGAIIKGGKLLPGFSLKVKDLFDRAGQRR